MRAVAREAVVRSWQRLTAVDRVLNRVLPKDLFYNLGITGTKPR